MAERTILLDGFSKTYAMTAGASASPPSPSLSAESSFASS
jgi:hypothetical protein